MENHLRLLLESRLPIPFAVAVGFWGAFYFGSFWLSRKAFALSLLSGNPIGTIGETDPNPFTGRLIFKQLGFAAYMFGSSYFFKLLEFEAASVSFAGGMLVASVVGFFDALNVYLFSKAKILPGATEGHLDLSKRFAVQAQFSSKLSMALLCLCLGLLFPNLSLCGGAFILFMISIGYRRRLNEQ